MVDADRAVVVLVRPVRPVRPVRWIGGVGRVGRIGRVGQVGRVGPDRARGPDRAGRAVATCGRVPLCMGLPGSSREARMLSPGRVVLSTSAVARHCSPSHGAARHRRPPSPPASGRGFSPIHRATRRPTGPVVIPRSRPSSHGAGRRPTESAVIPQNRLHLSEPAVISTRGCRPPHVTARRPIESMPSRGPPLPPSHRVPRHPAANRHPTESPGVPRNLQASRGISRRPAESQGVPHGIPSHPAESQGVPRNPKASRGQCRPVPSHSPPAIPPGHPPSRAVPRHPTTHAPSHGVPRHPAEPHAVQSSCPTAQRAHGHAFGAVSGVIGDEVTA